MDKTNKITIFHNNWEKREELSQAVADLLRASSLDIDRYILEGSVLTGDIDEPSKAEFIDKFGVGLFDTLENLSYLAYVTTVEAPFVLSLGNPRNQYAAHTLVKTITVNVFEKDSNSILSEISDYSIKEESSVSGTAKKIVKTILEDCRWSNSEFIVG